jgi:hypothetical protein
MDQHNITQPAMSVWSLAQMLSDIDLGEYCHALIANGFDTWDQTLHITEEQLGHLGFKLGHRRRLLRQIASFKGYPFAATSCYSGNQSTAYPSTRTGESERRA